MWKIVPKRVDASLMPTRVDYSGGEGGNAYRVEVRMTDVLSYDDATVFMAFLATAAPDHRRLVYPPEHELRKVLLRDESPDDSSVLGVEVTSNEIIEKLGWSRCGDSFARLKASMKRLAGVIFFYHFRGQVWSSNLFGFRIDEASKALLATINPVSSSVIIGNRQSGCVMPVIHELRALSGETQLAAYFALVRLVKPGSRTSLSMASILTHIHGPSQTGKQRERFVEAIRAMEHSLSGWMLGIEGRASHAKIRISRPKIRGQ